MVGTVVRAGGLMRAADDVAGVLTGVRLDGLVVGLVVALDDGVDDPVAPQAPVTETATRAATAVTIRPDAFARLPCATAAL